jgi:hydroxyacid-oxoacid transhydrogenase
MDLSDLRARRVLVVTDPNVAKLAPLATVRASLEREGIDYEVYDRVRIEPTDGSFRDAIAFAQAGDFDAYVAVGGGSSIERDRIRKRSLKEH